MSWSQAVDQALCFGWIDGKLNRIDDKRHRQRFTPRKPGSHWSNVNDGFERDQPVELPPEYAGGLTEAARSYLEERPPWYRRASTHWVVSAKREETRSKRLATLVECSEQGLDVPPLRRS